MAKSIGNKYSHIFELPRWLSGKESAWQAGDTGSIPGSGRFPGEGNGNPFQYSCLGNPTGFPPEEAGGLQSYLYTSLSGLALSKEGNLSEFIKIQTSLT